MIKIYTIGARCEWCQQDRIDKGFVELGHELTPHIHEADLVYCNNFWFDSVISDKKAGKIKGKVIFNVLDLAPHLNDFPLEKAREQLKYADAVTCISETVKKDCEERLGISPHVIYQPIQPITKTNTKKYRYDFMFAGRVGDPNKRARLAAQALEILGVPPELAITTGTDYAPYGDFAGVVKSETLDDLYNSVRFVLFPSRFEGLGLPAWEALAAGKIPVVCRDLNVREEFLPTNLFPEYAEVEPNPVSIAKFIAKYSHEENYLDLSGRLYFYWKNNLEEKFSNMGVAGRILEIYKNL